MTQWHADIDHANLSSGVKLTVLSQHHVVRVVTADTLSIETPGGQRTQAQIAGVRSEEPREAAPFCLRIRIFRAPPVAGVFAAIVVRSCAPLALFTRNF